jgi:ATP-dependent RNA helicase DOB1
MVNEEVTSKVADKLLEDKIKKVLNSGIQNEDSLIDEETNLETFEFQGCLHENITPKSYNKKLEKPETPPAKQYPFVLDTFQQRAVLCLENDQSVLVSAHTSAGKTAVAQYAIAMALRDKQRVLYTSPIKALSNQKFRELQQEFKDVGLMTGDVSINTGASCIVMTTEILRNMLYKGSEITRETAWVIFDEVHYMRDKERGVVWEETMILLANTVKYVFLSATIPNAREFAMWICKIKNQPCNVVYTDYRPVPLQHYVYASGSEGIYLVVDDKGNFKEENFSKALAILNEDLQLDKIFDKKAKQHKKNQESDIKKLVTLIKENNLDPAIVFAFSKKDCEVSALSLSKMDLTTDDEKEMIERIYRHAIATLSEEDQNLPQIQLMLPLLKKGIGIHHGGLLPIVKECVELVFQEGFLKCLFSTETFSMGINMPAKTVVFTSIEKFDGEDYRWLTGGEYIQMSGRAGRRGLDERGITMMILNKKMDVDVCKSMLNGKSDALYSTFHLSYNMLTNLMRTEGITPEYIVKRSFHQFQSERAIPQIKAKVKEMWERYKEISLMNDVENVIKEKLSLEFQIQKFQDEISKIITQPENIVPFLTPGRLIKVKNWGWGIVVNFTKKKFEITQKEKKLKQINENLVNDFNSKEYQNSESKQADIYLVDTLLYCKNIIDADSKLLPGDMKANDGQMGVVPVILNSFETLSSIKLNLPQNLKEKQNLKKIEKMLEETLKRFKGSVPEPDPIKQLNIKDPRLPEVMTKLSNLKENLKEINKQCEELNINDQHEKLYKEKAELKSKINLSLENVKKLRKLVLAEDLNKMKRVLRRLEFIDKDEHVLKKGQVACIVSTTDALLLTDMLFNGHFNEIEPNLLCAMLSCFVANEGKSEAKPLKNPILTALHGKIQDAAVNVANVLVEAKIEVNPQEYKENYKNDFMDIALEWANGAKFTDVCKITDTYEGNIIRTLRRLDELIKELEEGANLIGNANLSDKLNQASALIRRGIVFAASLYLSA